MSGPDAVAPYPPGEPGAAAAADRRWGLGDVWVALLLYLVLAFAAGAVLLAVPDRPDPRAWAVVLSLVLPWVGLAGWPLLATATKGLGPVRELRLTSSGRSLLLGGLAGIAGLVLASVVAVVLQHLLGEPLNSAVGEIAESIENASPWPLVLLAVLSVLGAPVVEEIAFRGLMFGALEKRGLSSTWCVVITAVTFALFHFEPVRLPVLIVIGLVLGWVRAHTGSTLASMAAHMMNNLPGAIALLMLALD